MAYDKGDISALAEIWSSIFSNILVAEPETMNLSPFSRFSSGEHYPVGH
jgi:hypothetical protein